MMTPVDIEVIQALTRMANRPDAFAATIAKATLAIVEARYDAEFRADMLELSLAQAEAKIDTIRDLVRGAPGLEASDLLRRITELCGS